MELSCKIGTPMFSQWSKLGIKILNLVVIVSAGD